MIRRLLSLDTVKFILAGRTWRERRRLAHVAIDLAGLGGADLAEVSRRFKYLRRVDRARRATTPTRPRQ